MSAQYASPPSNLPRLCSHPSMLGHTCQSPQDMAILRRSSVIGMFEQTVSGEVGLLTSTKHTFHCTGKKQLCAKQSITPATATSATCRSTTSQYWHTTNALFASSATSSSAAECLVIKVERAIASFGRGLCAWAGAVTRKRLHTHRARARTKSTEKSQERGADKNTLLGQEGAGKTTTTWRLCAPRRCVDELYNRHGRCLGHYRYMPL